MRTVDKRHPACRDSVTAMKWKSLSREVEEWRPWTSLISQLSWLPSMFFPWPFGHPSQPCPWLSWRPFLFGEESCSSPSRGVD
jgi:hypothetical protein